MLKILKLNGLNSRNIAEGKISELEDSSKKSYSECSIHKQESEKFERSINRYRRMESKRLIEGENCQNEGETAVDND